MELHHHIKRQNIKKENINKKENNEVKSNSLALASHSKYARFSGYLNNPKTKQGLSDENTIYRSSFYTTISSQIQNIIKNKSLLTIEKEVDNLWNKLKVIPAEINNALTSLKVGLPSGDVVSSLSQIDSPIIRSVALILFNMNKLIKEKSIFSNSRFNKDKISWLIPHFKRTNNQKLDAYITLYTLKKLIISFTEFIKNTYKISAHHLGSNSIFDTEFFGSKKYYQFFSKFIKTYHLASKNELKKYLKDLTWLHTNDQRFIVAGGWKGNLDGLGRNLKTQISNTIQSIKSSDYLSSKNNIKSSLIATSHYLLLNALDPNPLTKKFQLFDFDLLTSTLIDFIPNFNWDYSNGTNKKSIFDNLELNTRETLSKEIFNYINNEVNDQILEYDARKLPIELQAMFKDIVSEIKRHLETQIQPSSRRSWYWLSFSSYLAKLKSLLSQAKNIINNTSATNNSLTDLEAKKKEIKIIKETFSEWNKYLSQLKTILLKLLNNSSFLKKVEELETYSTTINKQESDIISSSYNYTQYLNTWEKYKSIISSIDIFDKDLIIEKLKEPIAKLIINFKSIKHLKLHDNNLEISVEDIDLYALNNSAIKVVVSEPYGKFFNITNTKITPTSDGTKATLEYEVSLINHPKYKNKITKRNITLLASSKNIQLFNKILARQKNIDKWLMSEKINDTTVLKDFSFLKSIWDKYAKNKMNVFDNSKDEVFYKTKLTLIKNIEDEFKTTYSSYLENLKKQLINQFNSQYDKFISTIDLLKEKKYNKIISKFKALEVTFGNRKYIVYSEKDILVESMSLTKNDYKIVSIEVLKKYVNILQTLNKNLNDEIERIKKLFDISTITLSIPVNNQTTRNELINAFKNKIPKRIIENVDFELKIVKSVPEVPGYVKFSTIKETYLIGELLIDLPAIKKDISNLNLNLKITNKTKEEKIIRRFIQVLGFEVKKNQDFSIDIRKATKTLPGQLWITAFGQKIYGLLGVKIPQLKFDDISDLDLDLDLSAEITEEIVINALIKKLGFNIEKNKDFKIKIKQPTQYSLGLITITALDTKITGELLIYIPKKNLPIDLSKLKLDIENTITWYTLKDEVIKSFERALGFKPKIDVDYRVYFTNNIFATRELEGSVSFIAINTKLFSNYLKLNFNIPKSIDISTLKSKWPYKITQKTNVDAVVEEFINILRSPDFVPEKLRDFDYHFKKPSKQNEKGYIQFDAYPNSVLVGKLRLDIEFVDKDDKINEIPSIPKKPDAPLVPNNQKFDSNLMIKIIAGVVSSLIFLGIIIAIAAVFIKTRKTQLKIELEENEEENAE